MNIEKALHQVIKHIQCHEFQLSEDLCKKIIKKKPRNVEALHYLGVINGHLKDFDRAITYIKKALEIDPNYTDAYTNLGNIYQENKQLEKAISCYIKALTLQPHIAKTHFNLGIAYQDLGRTEDAVKAYKEAINLNFITYGLCNNLGLALHEKKQFDEAIFYFQKSIQLKHDFAEAYYNFGNTLKEKENTDEAINNYEKALQINPNYVEAYNNLGIALKDRGNLDKALAYFEKANRLNPQFPSTYINLGATFYEKGEFDKAIDYYKKVLQIDRNYADAHNNLAHVLLLCGNFVEGWKEYEWRWEKEDFLYGQRTFSQPVWDGSSLQGKTLFIYAEQGVGDEIMFSSLFPEVINQCNSCIIECDNRLVPLFSRSFSKAQFVERIQNADSVQSPLPYFDVVTAAGNLPLYLRSTIASFPQRSSYLIPDPVKVVKWHTLFSEFLGDGLKVGISWRGGKKSYVKKVRSISLEQWKRLFSIKGIHFINLQYGDCKDELQEVKEKLGITIHGWEDADPLRDLDNFAAQISALDLVISVDNSTVHMAGALGIPIWTLLPFVPDWRWMLNRNDSPWYPTMRLFRQPSPGDWESVMKKVEEELQKLISSKM